MRSALAEVLELEVSLLQSGMGGVAGAELACAVSNAGAGGCVGGDKLVDGALKAILERSTAGTDRPVGVNLIPEVVGPDDLDRQVAQVLAETPQRVYLSLFGMPEDDAVFKRIVGGTAAGGPGRHRRGRSPRGRAGCRRGGAGHRGRRPPPRNVDGTRSSPNCACGFPAPASSLRADRLARGGRPGDRRRSRRGAARHRLLTAHESRAHSHFKAAVTAADETDTVISDVYEIGWPGRGHRCRRRP